MLPSKKVCSRCRVEKPLGDFTPQRGQKFGVTSYCKPCIAEYCRERRKHPVRRARTVEVARRRREDPALAERDRATSRAWKERNPERARAMYNKPEKREKDRLRRSTDRGRRLSVLTEQRRRAREVASGPGVSLAEWQAIVDEFCGRCAYCSSDGSLEMEHVRPLSRGGEHGPSNVVPACPPCNRRKGIKSIFEFLKAGP